MDQNTKNYKLTFRKPNLLIAVVDDFVITFYNESK